MLIFSLRIRCRCGYILRKKFGEACMLDIRSTEPHLGLAGDLVATVYQNKTTSAASTTSHAGPRQTAPTYTESIKHVKAMNITIVRLLLLSPQVMVIFTSTTHSVSNTERIYKLHHWPPTWSSFYSTIILRHVVIGGDNGSTGVADVFVSAGLEPPNKESRQTRR